MKIDMKDNKTDQQQTNEELKHPKKTGDLDEQLKGYKSGDSAIPEESGKDKSDDEEGLMPAGSFITLCKTLL